MRIAASVIPLSTGTILMIKSGTILILIKGHPQGQYVNVKVK